MGIKNLLVALQQSTAIVPIGNFRGSRVAIDVSGWLHRGLYSVVEDYIDNCDGVKDNQFYVDYILNRIKGLRDVGVEPILVFDGKRNSLKSDTQDKREEIRISNMDSATRLIESMRAASDINCREKLRAEAVSALQKGLSVSHEMEINTIAALRRLGQEVIVAPFEADAQLAYLCRIGYCDAVLTEDSDILVYSAISGQAFNIFYKYDKSGFVQLINLGQIGVLEPLISTNCSDGARNIDGYYREGSGTKEKVASFITGLKSFRGLSGRRMFVQMCILAGCDYIESIRGVGLATAQQVQ